MTACWRETPEGATILVKVQPRARRPGLQGTMESASGVRLRIAVTEAAEDGKANRAARDALAEALDVPRSAVRVVAGTTNREKQMAVASNAAVLAGKLRAL